MSLEDLVKLIWGSLSPVEKGMVLFTLVVYVLFVVYSCIALTRIPMEIGYLSVVDGQKIIWLRVLLGIPLPLIAGLLAGVVVSTMFKM